MMHLYNTKCWTSCSQRTLDSGQDGGDRDDDSSDWRDVLAFVIAIFETMFVPILLLILVLVIITIAILYL
jgi:hypothetical protein